MGPEPNVVGGGKLLPLLLLLLRLYCQTPTMIITTVPIAARDDKQLSCLEQWPSSAIGQGAA
jgi:hypothetical protein